MCAFDDSLTNKDQYMLLQQYNRTARNHDTVNASLENKLLCRFVHVFGSVLGPLSTLSLKQARLFFNIFSSRIFTHFLSQYMLVSFRRMR